MLICAGLSLPLFSRPMSGAKNREPESLLTVEGLLRHAREFGPAGVYEAAAALLARERADLAQRLHAMHSTWTLSANERQQLVRDLRDDGVPPVQIAALTGYSRSNIYRLRSGASREAAPPAAAASLEQRSRTPSKATGARETATHKKEGR
jgi:hypothetical protein